MVNKMKNGKNGLRNLPTQIGPSQILQSEIEKNETIYKNQLTEQSKREQLSLWWILIIDIPAGAILLLSKGLGYVKTPSANMEDMQLDMRLAIYNILKAADKTQLQTQTPVVSNTGFSKLYHRSYNKRFSLVLVLLSILQLMTWKMF